LPFKHTIVHHTSVHVLDAKTMARHKRSTVQLI